MNVLNTAAVLANESAEQGASIPAWVFGVSTFVILGALLVATMMIKVGRD